jgi:hypothetical protein
LGAYNVPIKKIKTQSSDFSLRLLEISSSRTELKKNSQHRQYFLALRKTIPEGPEIMNLLAFEREMSSRTPIPGLY